MSTPTAETTTTPAPAPPKEKKTRRVTIDGEQYTEFTRANGKVARVKVKTAGGSTAQAAPKGGGVPAVLVAVLSAAVLAGAGVVAWRLARRAPAPGNATIH